MLRARNLFVIFQKLVLIRRTMLGMDCKMSSIQAGKMQEIHSATRELDGALDRANRGCRWGWRDRDRTLVVDAEVALLKTFRCWLEDHGRIVAGQDAIRIEVRGEGMRYRPLSRMFEPFVQSGRVAGCIEVASQRAQGARFIVSLRAGRGSGDP
ncbi:hypothetical protein, partial [Nevskia sp.]|uniref:hypothetical protein n=1 Tax=Nevskia sp. TaxID=1929292 RepID=UPI0025F3FA24